MPGFTSRDNIIYNNTVLGQQDQVEFFKVGTQTPTAGNWFSLWTATGQPGAGTNTSGATVSNVGNQTAGAIWVNDQAAAYKFLVSWGAVSTQPMTLMLYERLSTVATQSLVTRPLTLAPPLLAPNRYNGGTGQAPAVNNQVWLEITTQTVGAGTATLTTYVSADGTAAQTAAPATAAVPAGTTVTSMIRLPLSPTKRGILSATVLTTTGTTTGIANVVMIRPLARISLQANQWNEISLLDDTMGLSRIYDGATLGLAYQATGTVAPTVFGQLNMIWG
jgi:hypothetical protein